MEHRDEYPVTGLILAYAVAAVAAVRGLWSPCGLSMVTALNPMSERARGHRYGATVTWYVVGALGGGAVLGLGCAVCALAVAHLHLRAATVAAVVLLAALAAWVSDSDLVGWSLPLHPRQVNEEWITRYRRWIYAAGFGAQIGTGFATYIMSAVVYLAAALAVMTGAPGGAFAVCVTFGLVRGLGILCGVSADGPERLRAVHRRLDRHAGASLLACLLAEVVVVGASAWTLVGGALAVPVVAVLVSGTLAPSRWRAVLAR